MPARASQRWRFCCAINPPPSPRIMRRRVPQPIRLAAYSIKAESKAACGEMMGDKPDGAGTLISANFWLAHIALPDGPAGHVEHPFEWDSGLFHHLIRQLDSRFEVAQRDVQLL